MFLGDELVDALQNLCVVHGLKPSTPRGRRAGRRPRGVHRPWIYRPDCYPAAVVGHPPSHRAPGQPRWVRPAAIAVSVLVVIGAIVAIGTAYSRRDRVAPASALGQTSPATADPSAIPGPRPTSSPSARPSTTRPAASRAPAATAKPQPGVRTAKKGVSAWYFGGFTRALADVRASWYYNWASGRGNLT